MSGSHYLDYDVQGRGFKQLRNSTFKEIRAMGKDSREGRYYGRFL